jgi:hypothetical protein
MLLLVSGPGNAIRELEAKRSALNAAGLQQLSTRISSPPQTVAAGTQPENTSGSMWNTATRKE